MKTIVLFVVFAFVFSFSNHHAFASNPPILISPINNSETTSSKVSWEAPSYPLYPNNPYNIEIDNNSDFSSPEKDYSTNNTSYSPKIDTGIWYWRVRAKDLQGSWSEFSNSWRFTLGTATPNPQNTSTPAPSEKQIQESKPVSQFTIKDIPTEINSNESFDVEINLEIPSNPNSIFYLKGAFKEKDSSNYFGQTYVSNSWIKNNAKYPEQHKISTDDLGKYSGKIKIMPDSEDTGFNGSGQYIFKIARYSESGSGPTWSEEKQIKINEVSSNASQSDEQPITSTSTPKPILTAKLTSASKSSYIASPANNPSINPQIAGIATESPEIKIGAERSINWWSIWGGIIFLLLGISFVVKFIYDKRQENKNIN